jgi:hypothetical protein
VIFLLHYPGALYDFLVICPAGIIAVCTRRSRRLHGSLAEIAEQYRDTIAMVGTAEFSPGMVKEFWLWSPYGTMRFFRVEGPVLTELDRQGNPVGQPVTGIVTGKKRTRVKEPVKKDDAEKPGENIVPETMPGPDAGAKLPEVPSPDSGACLKSVREPAPIRYLKHRTRERRNQKDPPAVTVLAVPDREMPGAVPPAAEKETSPS